MAHDVFISHSSEDKATADALCAALEAARVRCWIAPRDVQAGRPFPGQITRAIEQCRVMVLVFSATSNSSDEVLREVQLAARSRAHIVNFRIENVPVSDDLDYYLTLPHWLDALTPPLDRHHGQLVESVRALLTLGLAPAQAPAMPEPQTGESSSAAGSLPPPPPSIPPPITIDRPPEIPAVHGLPLAEPVPPPPAVNASPPAGRPALWLIALSGLLSGFLSSEATLLWGKSWRNHNDYFPGLGFGLMLGVWLLWTKWLKTVWLPVFLLASTIAYTAAHYTAHFTFVALYNNNVTLSFLPSGLASVAVDFPSVYTSLLLVMAGLVGGAVGTSLLAGALALLCAPFRRRAILASLLAVGMNAGVGLCLLWIIPQVLPSKQSLDWAYQLFIAVWQLAVVANIGLWLTRDLEGDLQAGSRSWHPWARRLAWAEAVVLVGIVAFSARCFVENRRLEATSALQTQQNEARGLLDEASKASRPDEWMAVIEKTTTLIVQAPQLAAAYLSRAAVYQKLKQPARAIQDYDAAIERDANSAPAYNSRGTAYDDLGQPERAVEDYTRAIELDPKYAPAYYNRGVACRKLGQHAQAVRDGTKAIELDPDNAFVYLARGSAHDALGHWQLAIDDYTRAIEVERKLALAYLARASAYQALGNPDAARRDLTKARELQKAVLP